MLLVGLLGQTFLFDIWVRYDNQVTMLCFLPRYPYTLRSVKYSLDFFFPCIKCFAFFILLFSLTKLVLRGSVASNFAFRGLPSDSLNLSLSSV